MVDIRPKITLVPKVAQRQVLTPSLVQMVNVLALNRLELREMIDQEMVENPILDEVPEGVPSAEEAQRQRDNDSVFRSAENNRAEGKDPFDEIDFGSYFQDYLDPGFKSPSSETNERPPFENFIPNLTSLADHLEWQLRCTPCLNEVSNAASFIIGNLNEDGYLTVNLEEIIASGPHSPKDSEEALKIVQQFDPLGVGGRDLRESLLIQLNAVDPGNQLAKNIISKYLHQVESRQYRQISRSVGRPMELVESAVALIRKLHPRPGQRYNNASPHLIEPDVYFVKLGDAYQIRVNDDGLPQLRISPYYRRVLNGNSVTRDVRSYVKERVTSAIQLIKNLEQRKRTIVQVCESIVGRQEEFLDHGMDHLKPMMIKEVAEEVGVHASTVSRAVSSKYAYTPQGVLELRAFFSEAVRGPSGRMLSLVSLKRMVKKMIKEEDQGHPLTDEEVTLRLNGAGVRVTRRTVAKYREDMRIPSTHQRRMKS